jgi:hypothetical protein
MTRSAARSRLCTRPGFRDVEPIFELLWELPEFQAMVAEIEADMAAQLARAREMERNGELEPVPEVSATAH